MTCERCEILEQQIRDMRGEDLHIPAEWGLYRKEALLLRALIGRGHMSREGLLVAVYGFGKFPGDRTIDQMVGRIRRKLAHMGIIIKSVCGYGYELIGHKDWQRKLEEGAP